MISPVNAVVVVFPFVPVIAISLPFAKEYASSISPQMQTFCARIRSTTGRSVGTPGLKTATSNARSCASVSSPKAPAFLSVSVPFHITFLHPDLCFHHREQFQFFLSNNSSDAAMPLFPAPTTRTFFPSSFITINLHLCV